MERLPAIQKTLADYCEIRDRVLALLEDGRRQISAADAEMKSAYSYGLPWDIARPFDMERATREVDQRFWRQAFAATGFMEVMDAQALGEFQSDLDRRAPPFTLDNVRTTFLSLLQEADKMFARGAVNVFRKLDKAYRTNEKEPFRIGPRAILGSIFQARWSGGIEMRSGSWASGQINDLDRVFRVLDGKPHAPQALEIAINAAFGGDKRGPWVYEDEYFRIKGFLNGNAHFAFLREDLLEKANRLIGKFYGDSALAQGRSGDPSAPRDERGERKCR